jgi:hypothetical protein
MHDRLPDIQDAKVMAGKNIGQRTRKSGPVAAGEIDESYFAHV